MEYEPSKVPVTGLARWDKLENTADPAHPFIIADADMAKLAGRPE